MGFANEQWQRAVTTLETARRIADDDPDSAASRAFYAAFDMIAPSFAAEKG